MNNTSTINLYQPLLQSIAYQVLGSVSDAEDMVQDTFLKWFSIDDEKRAKIENVKAYLIKSVTNNCLNHIERLKVRGGEYLDNLLPNQISDGKSESFISNFDLEHEVSEALAILGKKLEPLEKGIYILREVFNFEYEELQEIFDKKKENCRQIFSRVQKKLKDDSAKINFDNLTHLNLVENFKTACKSGLLMDLLGGIQSEMDRKLVSKNKS